MEPQASALAATAVTLSAAKGYSHTATTRPSHTPQTRSTSRASPRRRRRRERVLRNTLKFVTEEALPFINSWHWIALLCVSFLGLTGRRWYFGTVLGRGTPPIELPLPPYFYGWVLHIATYLLSISSDKIGTVHRRYRTPTRVSEQTTARTTAVLLVGVQVAEAVSSLLFIVCLAFEVLCWAMVPAFQDSDVTLDGQAIFDPAAPWWMVALCASLLVVDAWGLVYGIMVMTVLTVYLGTSFLVGSSPSGIQPPRTSRVMDMEEGRFKNDGEKPDVDDGDVEEVVVYFDEKTPLMYQEA
ncbi:Uu.00g052750.m01.CDS01 [Anthostomella pinea]|uniref:Uu.00g052750.m01.CDS01 n=1 Tax=Anthostomella pinea TaxID=933095 RepID=A0AAI8YPI1_9PEZI|nr:Uu.00g052750.m01.CDS01 [Anthostomella pinea]